MIRYLTTLTTLAARLHRPRCPECGESWRDLGAHFRLDHADLEWSTP